jgi:hypothetical protein
MGNLQINADLFKSPESYQEFLDVVKKTIKEAGDNLVPIIFNGKVLCYMAHPDNPFIKE